MIIKVKSKPYCELTILNNSNNCKKNKFPTFLFMNKRKLRINSLDIIYYFKIVKNA